MADTPESIQKIRINGEDHPIDAVTLNEKSTSDFLDKSKLVTELTAESTDEQVPSAKCVYDIIY